MIGFNHLGIVGRLGNQMFQYTTLRGIADKHGYDFIIPESDFADEWNDHQLFESFSNFLILRIEGRLMTSISKNVSFILIRN